MRAFLAVVFAIASAAATWHSEAISWLAIATLVFWLAVLRAESSMRFGCVIFTLGAMFLVVCIGVYWLLEPSGLLSVVMLRPNVSVLFTGAAATAYAFIISGGMSCVLALVAPRAKAAGPSGTDA